MLLCDKTHVKIIDTIGGVYNVTQKKLLITKALIRFEIFFINRLNNLLNMDKICIMQIKTAILSLIQLIYKDNTLMPRELISDSKNKLIKAIDNNNKEATTDISIALLENDIKTELLKKNESNEVVVIKSISSILEPQKKPKNLFDSEKYKGIIHDLDSKLQQIIDINTPDVVIDKSKGGSKKRRTKKAKKHINKRRYSRKH